MATTAKRVALICDYSLEYLGGAQSAFLDSAAVLRESGVEVTVVAPHVGATPTDPDRFPVQARWTLPGVDLPVVRNTAALRRDLRDLFVERGIEVVHCHSEFGLTAAAVQVAADLGLPVVHTVHTFFWQGPRLGLLDRPVAGVIRLFGRWLRGERIARRPLAQRQVDSALRGITLTAARHAQTVVSPSAHQGARLREAGLANVAIVPNTMPGADAEAKPLTAIDGPLRIAWVARLVPEKRILEFLDAVLRASVSLGPDRLEVTVVGDGPLMSRAREIAAGTPGLRFAGRVDRDRVRGIMRESHLVALTSFGFDNQPVIVVEALNEARSVLYVDDALQEGLSEAGILASGPDAAGMAATLIELARDPRRVVEQSQRALAAAEQFSPAGHVRALQQIYTAPAGGTA
ncbi:glycosyltransferase family 4 protein [uncultured Microbacterium sp.]|uniref:glycosyltransferase family 4 protein n=1 Tax=uncultured Microbacterium sp. TaxID=191216 RepID=UPI00262B70FA|nr:glycosyltransferase family 4 protein [uncultured Microbacterium sp.]